MEQQVFRKSRKERVGYSLFMVGQGMYNCAVGYVQVFYTKMGIAATIVGAIILATRVWDAVNDPLFGMIVDRVNLKGGRLLPWLKVASFALPAAVMLIFLMPEGISVTAKVFWSLAAYIIFESGYTMSDVPIFSMTSAMTDQVQERVSVMSVSTIAGGVALFVVTAGFPLLYNSIGWPLTALAVCVPAFLCTQFLARNGKERFTNKDDEKVTLRVMFQYIKENKFLRIYYIGLNLLHFTNTTQTVVAFFAANNLGNENLTTLLIAIVAGPALLMALLLPALTKRFDRFHLFLFSVVGNGILCVVQFFAGYENLPLFYGLLILRGIFMGAGLLIQLMFTADIVEYGEYKTGKRLQGTAFSIQTFSFKFFNAVAGAAAMFILGAFGFEEGRNVVQSPETQNVIWLLISLFPAIGTAVSLPVLTRYRLRDKDVQLMAKVNNGELSREEAERLFINQY